MGREPPLPSGTVTFLFTDIEGSTRLWEQHPAAMRDAMARHHPLLRGDTHHLRLEREGERFTSLCRTDGTDWLTCGQVDFAAADPLLVGIASLRGVVADFD